MFGALGGLMLDLIRKTSIAFLEKVNRVLEKVNCVLEKLYCILEKVNRKCLEYWMA